MRFRLKPLLVASGAAAAALTAALCVQAGPQTQRPQLAAGQRVVFQVDGLSCGSCEGRVRKALTAKPGVREVEVDLDRKLVAVSYEEGRADPKALADTIASLGYPARYLSSGPAVPGVRPPPARSAGGCGGDCCKGGGG